MLIECKKIVKWKNGGIAFDEVRWRKERIGGGGQYYWKPSQSYIIAVNTILIITVIHKSIRYERQHFLDLIKQFRFAEVSFFTKHGHDIFDLYKLSFETGTNPVFRRLSDQLIARINNFLLFLLSSDIKHACIILKSC